MRSKKLIFVGCYKSRTSGFWKDIDAFVVGRAQYKYEAECPVRVNAECHLA